MENKQNPYVVLYHAFKKRIEKEESNGYPDSFLIEKDNGDIIIQQNYRYHGHITSFYSELRFNRHDTPKEGEVKLTVTYHLIHYLTRDNQPLRITLDWLIPEEAITDRGSLSYSYINNVCVDSYFDHLFTVNDNKDYYVKVAFTHEVIAPTNGWLQLKYITHKSTPKGETAEFHIRGKHLPHRVFPVSINQVLYSKFDEPRFHLQPECLPNLIIEDEKGVITLHRPNHEAEEITLYEFAFGLDEYFKEKVLPLHDTPSYLQQCLKLNANQIEAALVKRAIRTIQEENKEKDKTLYKQAMDTHFKKYLVNDESNRNYWLEKSINEDGSLDVKTKETINLFDEEGNYGVFQINLKPVYEGLTLTRYVIDAIYMVDIENIINVVNYRRGNQLSQEEIDDFIKTSRYNLVNMIKHHKAKLTYEWQVVDNWGNRDNRHVHGYHYPSLRLWKKGENENEERNNVELSFFSHTIYHLDDGIHICFKVECFNREKPYMKYVFELPVERSETMQQALESERGLAVLAKIEKLIDSYHQWVDIIEV